MSRSTEISAEFNRLRELGRQLLVEIGEDPTREGLRETPDRFARYWQEFINYEAGKLETTFDSVSIDQMVIVTGMRVWSLCEHHLLPFWCDVSVGYIAQKEVIGLSKIPRICHKHAHKLQLQERLVSDIATDISDISKTDSVAVIARGVHTCMAMRGIKSDGTMVSSVMRGRFKESHETRMEFLQLSST
jgi:GTP cyclohydrolase I